MNRSLLAVGLSLAFAVSLPAASFAQETKQEEKKETPKEEPKKDPKVVDYEKAIKDLKRIDGPFPLYQRKKDLLLELPEDKLGKIFLFQAAFNTGLDSAFMHAGMPIGGNAVDAFRFDKNDDQVWLVRPRIANRWDEGDPFAVGAERQFQEAILGNFKIEQTHPDKKLLLVNVTNLFMGETLRMSEMIGQGLGGAYMLDREKSSVEKVKGFPENTVLQLKLHYFSARGGQQNPLMALLGLTTPTTLEDERSAPLKVSFNLSWRKDTGYMPRVGDPRVGYFDQQFFSVAKYLNTDRTEHFINRWNLQKKDPKAEVSEPVKPIVWTIDPSIPPAYREAVKEGVLRWNKAFNALGYKNAIQVQDVPKEDEDYDHADGRYNVIRMITTPSCPFGAISLFRTDPFTGEILNSSITLDGNLVRDMMQEHKRVLSEATVGHTKASKVLLRDRARTETDDSFLFTSDLERAQRQVSNSIKSFGWSVDSCSHAAEMKEHEYLAWTAVRASGGALTREAYVKHFLADCVSHELGHCLGLRHNFAGSTNLTTAQLADDAITSEMGISASVMDYTPANVQAILRGRGNFYMPTIGPYDVWAIKYGYMETGAKSPLGERYALSQVAKLSGVPGHAYMTDEDADGWNPLAVRFDLGKDTLSASEKQLQALKRARDYAIKNLPRPGESYAERTELVMGTIARSMREARTAARFVGGTIGRRHFKGDVGEKPTLEPVDANTQREAMSLIARHFFAPEAFDLPAEVLSTLSASDEGGGWNAPLRDVISGFQTNLLAMTMSASTTDRVAENAFKKNSYGLDDHYGLLLGAVFREVGQDKSIAPLRRDLQRFALNGLMVQASAPHGAVNEDVRMIASDSLKRLLKRFEAQAASTEKLDGLTKVHLRDSADSIKRFLSRSVSGSR